MFVKQLINFEIFISTNEIFFLNVPLLSFTIFFDLEEIIFENFNISENNIIGVESAKVLLRLFPPSLCVVLLRRECPPHSPKHLLWLLHF